MQLKDRYQLFSESINLEDILAEPLAFENYKLEDFDKWFYFLSVFEKLLEVSKNKSVDAILLKSIYEILINNSADFRASVYLNEEDYTFFHHKLTQQLEHYAQLNTEAWVELGLQFVLSRRFLQNKDLAKKYLEIAQEKGESVAAPLLNYYNYVSIFDFTDKDIALQNLKELAGTQNPWGIIYYNYIQSWGNDSASVPAAIEPLKDNSDKKVQRHYFQILQSYYRSIGDQENLDKTLEIAVNQYDSSYCKYLLTEMKLANTPPEADKTEIIQAFKETFEYGIIEAATSIALILLPQQLSENTADYDEAIYWLNKSWEYGYSYAAYRLGCLYLYNQTLNNANLGLHFIDEGAKANSVDAEIEWAELHLDGRFMDVNDEKAISIFNNLAEKNVPYAKYRLGNFFEYGNKESEPNYEKAFEFYSDAAEQKLPQALYQVGRFYKYGIGNVTPDNEKAKPYFLEAANSNNVQAITELGLLEEVAAEPDYAKAFSYFDTAAQLGYPYANYIKGVYLENDYHKSGAQQPAEAFKCYSYAAEYNDINALYELGRCYRHGIGTDVNPDKAIELYTKAADANHAKALTELGICYEIGFGVSKDLDKALGYFTQAADLGYFYAQYICGRYYMHGFVTQDSQKGLEYFQQAAATNYPYAFIEIGDYYFYDYDQIDQPEKAFEYYKKAEEQGVISDGIGMCYEFGIGVDKNAEAAFNYYQRAAQEGNITAKYRLGRCLYFGIGTNVDATQAFPWFNEAAQDGNIYAAYYAGLQLLEGDGVLADTNKGIEWIQASAEANFPEAQYKLGNCYLMGEGVSEDDEKAMQWFEKAAENGHEGAMKITKRKRR
ncbi:tetratricopeptide repeat protein [Rhizosphaericola mali]|uniref:Sel1 repeat family protein n=1 Tax=Rhizosphaericola mali TaxID=2545455 RepID=A0A5P2FZ89_9BACT|nr:SEL1-like repeat protein [Rhizosphaericola mali]QES88257.1 sel1 repeat family protein [Rhizosphaericola mali]